MADNSKNQVTCQTVPLFAVYVIWCRLTNQFYVGVTNRKVERRISEHKSGKQYVDREIQRLGWEGNFDWWIVSEHVRSDQISECEQQWVKFFDCVHPKGYNKTIGGISLFKHTEESKETMRQAQLGRHHTEESKEAMRQAHLGKPLSEEHKAKLSESKTGEKHPMYGKHHTEESKEIMRQKHLGNSAHKGKHHTEETKAILREKALERNVSGENNPFFGKNHTEEAKERNRQAHLGKTPWNKGKKMTEEQKAIMREKRRATRAAKAAAEENRAAAYTAPTNLSNLLDAVILQKGLSSEISVA